MHDVQVRSSTRRPDPPQADDQLAHAHSPGRDWLVLGLLLAAVSLAVLIPLSGMQAGVALGAAGLVLLLLIAMGIVNGAILARRALPIALGLLFCAMAAVALAGVVLSAVDAIG